MESLQVVSIKSIINGISDNEQLLTLIDYLHKKREENINSKYKEHYWSHEDGKFDNRLKQSTFHSNDEKNFDVEENGIRYRFNVKLEDCPLFIRNMNSHKYWKLIGTHDNPTLIGYLNANHEDMSGEVFNYAIFLWKHKPQ